MRAAARIVIMSPGNSQPDFLMAHSLKASVRHPWDSWSVSTQHQQGTNLFRPSDPCMPQMKRLPEPRVTGDEGGRVGQYFRFDWPGRLVSSLGQQYQMLVSAPDLDVLDP